MTWLNENHVPAEFRTAIPADLASKPKRALARWYSKEIGSKLHPDQFVGDEKKKTLNRKISTLVNKVISKLKGLS